MGGGSFVRLGVPVACSRRRRCAYFSFFALAPLTLAVPRRVFCLFLRCFPVCQSLSVTVLSYTAAGERRLHLGV
jgi:hypothetical protein